MRKRGSRAKTDAVLRHLGCGRDLEDFPGTRYEQLGLIHTARSRGLVEWQEERGRYELTPIGWRHLTPRRLGLASLMAGTAIGATVAAATLAFFWLPGDASQGSVGRPATAALSRAADANGAVPAVAPRSQTARTAPAAPAAAHDPAPGARPDTPTDPATVAAQPVPEEPSAEAPAAVVKQAAVKKPRHKTVRNPAWASTTPYRDERYSGFGRIYR
jgi:hypothetical protein